MTKTEILDALAHDYHRASTVYESMKKQDEMLLEQGKMDDHHAMAHKANFRAGLLSGIKRAAITLGISDADFMAAVEQQEKK